MNNDAMRVRQEGISAIKKLVLWIGLPVFLLLATLIWAKIAFNVVEIEQGTEGVVMDKPWVFGTGGIEKDTIKPGRYVMWASKKILLCPTTPLIEEVEFNDLMTADNIMLDFAATVEYQIGDCPTLLSKFGNKWFANNVERQFRSMTRREVKQYDMTSVLTGGKAADTIDVNLTTGLETLTDKVKLPIIIRGLSLGSARPNETVQKQMNETATQQTRRKTLVEAGLAEDQRKVVEQKKAAADVAYRDAMKMSLDEYMTMEKNRMWSEACKASGNCVLVPEGSSVIVGKN